MKTARTPTARAVINAPNEKTKRAERVSVPATFAPHFVHESRQAARAVADALAKRIGAKPETFHVLEEHARFAVASTVFKPSSLTPAFAVGETVFDVSISNSRAKVIATGPYQTEVKYQTGPFEGAQRFIPNIYLTKLGAGTKTRATINKV